MSLPAQMPYSEWLSVLKKTQLLNLADKAYRGLGSCLCL